MKYNYCTLFNVKYLSRGLALYESLVRVKASFHLYVLAMDAVTAEALRARRLKDMTVITLNEFESPELNEIKKTRTLQEYCWTCTPSIIAYCLETFALEECTYLDADIFFFAKPEILQKELQGHSLLITEHRYHVDYDYSSTSGRFCVQYVTFKNDKPGKLALEWWRKACNEWCHAYYDDGKFGDQKYLDDWPQRFKRVKILQHHGGGVAPWNLSSYYVDQQGKRIEIVEKKTGNVYPLVFYHFHDLRIDKDGNWHHGGGLPGYHIGRDAYRHIYAPYLKVLFSLRTRIKADCPTDMPALPKSLTELQFDKMLLPQVQKRTDRDFLRQVYRKEDAEYALTSPLEHPRQQRAFFLLIEAGYNLDRYAFWPFAGNYVHELLAKSREKKRIVPELKARLKQTKIFGVLREIRQKLRAHK